MDFKIIFPGGYTENNEFDGNIDVNNSNIDINIILKNGDVFFATLFTVLNVDYLLNKNNEPCFWATDMLIVKDLSKKTIKEAITQMIYDQYIEIAFTNIGGIEKHYPGMSFEKIPDMSNGFDIPPATASGF